MSGAGFPRRPAHSFAMFRPTPGRMFQQASALACARPGTTIPAARLEISPTGDSCLGAGVRDPGTPDKARQPSDNFLERAPGTTRLSYGNCLATTAVAFCLGRPRWRHLCKPEVAADAQVRHGRMGGPQYRACTIGGGNLHRLYRAVHHSRLGNGRTCVKTGPGRGPICAGPAVIGG